MPVVRFRVRNEYGHADPELYGAADRDDPEALLEGVAMAGLVGVLRQLGDLAEFAAGIFHNLHEEVMSTSARGHSLMLRVQQLEAEFPAIEKAFLSQTTHLHTINNTGTEWHPNIQIGQNLITSGDMPRFILDSYEECRGPPRLFMLDKFDVAGAGACLKRYSDPSFFKTDLASSGAIEAELQREKRPRKTKKKNLRGRNDENFESSPDPDISILNHMHPEKTQTFPAKRVKLKTRPLNNKDATTRSYMECVLESYIPNEDISNINTIEHSPEKTTSPEPSVPILEIHAGTRAVSSDIYLSFDKQVQSATDRVVEGENADREKKNEMEQMITKSLSTDETGLLLQCFGSPEKIEGKDEGNALEQLFEKNSVQLNQHAVLADTEDRTDAESDVYVSDDIASDLENYMDALATIESEIETDSENRPKPQFSPSNEELQEMDPETPDEKKMKNLQNLSANLTEDQNSNSLSEREVSCLANKEFLSILSDPDSVQKGQVQSPMCENAEITFSPVNKDSFCDPIQPLRVGEVHSSAHQYQSSSDLPVNAGASSGGEHDLTFEQGHSHISEKLFDMSSSIFETVEASCSSLPMNSASPTDSGTQGSCGTNNPTCVNPYTTYFDSLDAGGVCQQSDFTPGENFATTDIANIVSSISDDANSTRALIRISDSDFKCSEPLSMINESPVEGAQIEDVVPDASQRVLLDAENLILTTNSEDSHEVKPCLDCVIDPTQDTLTTGIPNSDGYDGVCSCNDQYLFAAGEEEPCRLQKNGIDCHPGFDILSINAQRDAPVTYLDVSPDAIVAEPGPATTVSDTKDSDDMWSTSADVNAIFFVDKSQTLKAERDELFPNNAVSAKLPVPSSTDRDLPGSVEVFSDALDNDGIKLSVIPEDQLSLSSSCITSESRLPSIEEHRSPSNFVSDHPKPDENNYGQHYSPFSHSGVQLSKDTTTSDPVPKKHDPEKDECLCSVIQEELVTNRASGILSSQNEEDGETLNQTSEDTFDHEMLSSSCGELSALKSVSADRDKTGEKDVAQEAVPRHDFVPDMPDEHADVSVIELHAQRTCQDPCQENEEVELGNNEKEPRLENMFSVREATDLNPGQLCQYSDKEEVEVGVIQKISAKEEIIFQSPDVSYSDTMNDISLVHKPVQITAVSRDEANSRALLSESDAGPNLEPLSHRIAEGYVSQTPEPTTAGTIQLTSEAISSVTPISFLGDKENSSDQDSQLDAVHIREQVCFSHASQSLSDSQTVPSMPCTTSVTDGSKDNIETDLSHSKADPNISVTNSGMIPFSFSLKSSSETPGHKDESNLLRLSSSTSEAKAHSEAKVALQSDFMLSIMPSDHSPQLSVASFSGPNLPVANPTHMNASESTGNGLLFNFPLLGPDIQCNLNDAPPLPPLPPLQWRMGKPKISHQGSIATTSKSCSGSDDFSIITANELPSNDPKTLGVSVQGAETFSQPVLIENRISQGGSTEDVPSLASANTSLTKKEGAERSGSVSVYSLEENLRTKSLSSDATDAKIENSLRRRKALKDEMAPSTNAFAPLLPSSEIGSQRISSISYTEQMQLSSQSILPPTQGIGVHQNYTVMPQSFQTNLRYPSNTFRDAPVTMDPRYQYGYRLFGGESLQPLATQDIIHRHGFYMPVCDSMYEPYSISLTEMETEKLNGRPLSILNRPRDPLIEAVASHDKSTLRKVSEIVQTSAKPKDDERNTMLDQIKQKSFNLKRTVVTRPSISKGHTTNLKVTAILEKANAIRQAFAGSDDEDNWSDG